MLTSRYRSASAEESQYNGHGAVCRLLHSVCNVHGWGYGRNDVRKQNKWIGSSNYAHAYASTRATIGTKYRKNILDQMRLSVEVISAAIKFHFIAWILRMNIYHEQCNAKRECMRTRTSAPTLRICSIYIWTCVMISILPITNRHWVCFIWKMLLNNHLGGLHTSGWSHVSQPILDRQSDGFDFQCLLCPCFGCIRMLTRRRSHCSNAAASMRSDTWVYGYEVSTVAPAKKIHQICQHDT